MKLKSGDRVKVNGSEGIVELLQPTTDPGCLDMVSRYLWVHHFELTT